MLILAGKPREVPGIITTNWKDDPSLRLKMGEDGRSRGEFKRIRRIILHTTCGIPGGKDQRPQLILEGIGAPGPAAEQNVHYWTGNSGQAGAHLVVDRDGSVVQTCDLIDEMAFHAGGANGDSIGIEICQRQADASLYRDQLRAAARLVLWLCKQDEIDVQWQTQWPYKRPVQPINMAAGQGPVGVFAHYHQTTDRGPGDCGATMWDCLAELGIEKLDFYEPKKISDLWIARQQALGLQADGDPGPATKRALKSAGYTGGLYALGRPA